MLINGQKEDEEKVEAKVEPLVEREKTIAEISERLTRSKRK